MILKSPTAQERRELRKTIRAQEPAICPNCSGLLFEGESIRRCPCAGRKFEIPTKPFKQGSIEAAHFFQLFKTIRTGSWTKTGYRPPWTQFRFQLKALHEAMPADKKGNRGFSIFIPKLTARVDDVAWFIYRCEVAYQADRNEFAGLMGSRLELWWAGVKKRKACDYLGLSEAKLTWLDRFIRKNCVPFPARCPSINPDVLTIRRRMKAGVAADILRRHQHGYKQSQALPAQVDNPFSSVSEIHI